MDTTALVGFTYNLQGELFRPNGKRCSLRGVKDGYRVVQIKGVNWKQHRIIFFLHYGYLPELIDHKDRNKANNAPDNLREATKTVNAYNTDNRKDNSTGYKCIVKLPQGNRRWRVTIWFNGNNYSKCFYTLKAAVAHRDAVIKAVHEKLNM